MNAEYEEEQAKKRAKEEAVRSWMTRKMRVKIMDY